MNASETTEDTSVRSLVPYTDEDLRRLYLEAVAANAPRPIAGPDWEKRKRTARLADVRALEQRILWTGAAVSIFCGYLAVAIYRATPFGGLMILVFGVMFAMIGGAIANHLLLNVEGPLGVHEREVLEATVSGIRQPHEVDLQSPTVIRTVVHYTAAGPLSHENHLQTNIRQQRDHLTQSLTHLERMEADLRKQTETVKGPELLSLIEAKLKRIDAVQERLAALVVELDAQSVQAAEAVRPIRELVDNIERLLAVDENLSGLESGYGLVASAEEHLSQNRVELQLLQAAVAKSAARLQSIEREVDGFQRAELEVDSLRSLAAPVPDRTP